MRRLSLSAGVLISLAFVIHYGAVSGHAGIALAFLGLLLLPMLIAGLRRRRGIQILMLLALAAGLWVLFDGLSLLYAVPVIINLALCGVFALTLLPGRKPLISAYVELQYESVSPAVYRYTRKVTLAWALFFAAMAVQASLLAWLAPVEIWSLFVNLLNYLLVACMFAAEYWVRRRVLRDHQHAGFVRFLANLTRTDFRSLLKQTT